MTPALHEAGDSALLLEFGHVISVQLNERVLAIARALRDARICGVRDVVPAMCSIGVHFDPLSVDRDRLWRMAARPPADAPAPEQRSRIEVPVEYGGSSGPDLQWIADAAGIEPRAVVDLHVSREYRVFMLGFLPGFPYLGFVESRIAMPRHEAPRARVSAGSVGIAGPLTGIYPCQSPGGWRIVGRTPLTLFDPERIPSCLVAPGDTVRFVPVHGAPRDRGPGGAGRGRPRSESGGPEGGATTAARRRVTVIAPGLLTTIQDLGRWGHQSSGVPVAGPLDPLSHRLANLLVGNAREAAALEVTLAGPELRFEEDTVIAVTGASLDPTADGRTVPMNQAVRCRAGSVLRFGARHRGARAYVAFDGGIAAPVVLGSRATHVLTGMGGLAGRALRAGDTLALGEPAADPPRRRAAMNLPPAGAPDALRVLPGPQDGAFSPAALEALTHARFEMTPRSDRMGYRLGGTRLPGAPKGTMMSGPAFTGAIQVPPSGEPVMLMADRQTTGGYPQIATVISADLPAAGQLAPGDGVRFALCSRDEAVRALVRQEGMLLALE